MIIPSWGKERSKNLERLLEDLTAQSIRPDEVEIVRQVSPNGRARNVGAARTSGEILLFLDDDVRMGTTRVIEGLVRALERPEIGLAGTSQQLPPDSSAFQLSLAGQLPRSQSPIVSDYQSSDMVTTACCAIRREIFTKLGGFHEGLPRGVDPEFRQRIRGLGLDIVVAPDVWHYHPVPASLKELIRMAWRNGYSSAQVFRQYPELVIFNPEGHVSEFQAHRNPIFRYGRRVGTLVLQFLSGRSMGALYSLAYIAGYLYCLIIPPKTKVPSSRAAGPP